jgi:hypothetical protein
MVLWPVASECMLIIYCFSLLYQNQKCVEPMALRACLFRLKLELLKNLAGASSKAVWWNFDVDFCNLYIDSLHTKRLKSSLMRTFSSFLYKLVFQRFKSQYCFPLFFSFSARPNK